MGKPCDFGEIIITETDEYQSFHRKKLIKTYNKYNDIMNAFKHNKMYWCFEGEISRQILTKQEIKLIHQEIEDDTYKYKSKQEARYALLKYYHNELIECVSGMKQLIDELPDEVKATHFNCGCGSNVLMSHKARHLKSPLHLDFINNVVKVSPKSKASSVVNCGCGKTFSLKNKTHHTKTKCHLDWLSLSCITSLK